MHRLILVLAVVAFTAANVSAVTQSGVGAITESVGSIPAPGTGETNLVNTGTILDGLYGTENKAYLVDDYPGGLSWSDNLEFHATLVMNDDGTVSGADNIAILGYFADSNHGDGDYSPADGANGDRGQAIFGLGLLGPNDGRMFLNIGGNLTGPVGNWANDFGRNNPFNVDLFAAEADGTLTVTGTISDGNTTINVNQAGAVNPIQGLEAFGTSQGFGPQTGVERNYGMDISDLSYISTVPEPGTIGLALIGISALGFRRHSR